jgi:hypothetical protein
MRRTDAMPAMSWCELKITGLLSGKKADNLAEAQKFQDLFPDTVPAEPIYDTDKTYSTKAPWPSGLRLKNYKPAVWHSRVEELDTTFMGTLVGGVPVVTQLTFQAMLIGVFGGSLFSNRKDMLEEVQWFYHYCEYEWLKDLKKKMLALNADLAASGRLLNRVDVRDWKWYCGNGAGD